MTQLFGIAAVQIQTVPWDLDATIKRMEQHLQLIKDIYPWVNLACFPELCPYGIEPFKPTSLTFDQGSKAEEIPGPLSDRLSQLAKQYRVWLSPGSIYEREEDVIYNTAPIYSPEGELVAKYRKLFPWRPLETTASGRDFCTFDIPNIGCFGLMICNDGWFPEVIRTLIWRGAEVIIHPTLTFTIDRAPDLIVIQSHAILNQCYMINTNAAPSAGAGRSIIVDPNGRVLQQASTYEEILTEVIDLDLVRQVREFGTLGLDQHLKQFRDFEGEFPIYSQGIKNGKLFQTLGPVRLAQNFEDKLKSPKTED